MYDLHRQCITSPQAMWAASFLTGTQGPDAYPAARSKLSQRCEPRSTDQACKRGLGAGWWCPQVDLKRKEKKKEKSTPVGVMAGASGREAAPGQKAKGHNLGEGANHVHLLGDADLISGMVIRSSGSTSSILGMRSLAPGDSWLGRLYMPPLIFLNRLGMFSSSKGRLPHSRAYRMTPQLHTSTSGPPYSLPDITCACQAS